LEGGTVSDKTLAIAFQNNTAMAPSKRKRGGSSGGGQDRNKEKLTIELLGDASSR